MDEEFAHDRCEGDFEGFLLNDEALVKGLEDGVAVGGGERGHVKGTADFLAASADGALALVLAAIHVVGSQPGQSRTLAPVKGAQFRHFGQQLQGGDEANAFGGGEQRELPFPLRMGLDSSAQLTLQSLQPLFQDGDGLVDLGQRRRLQHLLAISPQDLEHLDELLAMGDTLAQGQLLPAQRWIGRRLPGLGKALDELGIEGVVLGDDGFGESEVADLSGMGHGEGQSGVLQGQAQAQVIRPGRFADHMAGLGQLLDPGDELAMAFLGIGKLPTVALAGDNQGILGDINSEVA